MNIKEDGGGVAIEDNRQKWGKKLDFILSCVGCAVGFGNVWRFPYLCYENGGATFLIPYFIMLAINGIPLFYMELAIGQYLSRGTVGAWTAICPIARGVGFGMIIVPFLVGTYYNVILAWCLLYLFESFRKDVPWKHCGNEWNTPLCVEIRNNATAINCTALGYVPNCKRASPSEEFYDYHILQKTDSISDMGHVNWQIALCLILAWTFVYLCLIKGVASSGKVVYFTATFPYVMLLILMIRGATLDGSLDGVIFYLKPDITKLKDPMVWVQACSQIFFSLGVGVGALLTLGSYNKFNNNCEWDAILVSCINSGTSLFAGFVVFSVLGFMAKTLKVGVGEVVASGPGLAFVSYPEAIAQMPVSTLWAILFFFMLLTIGLDSQFALVECVVTGLSDEYPKYLKRYKPFFLIGTCVAMFLLAIPMCAQGGVYVFNLFDSQAGGVSLLFVGFCEVAVIGWLVGGLHRHHVGGQNKRKFVRKVCIKMAGTDRMAEMIEKMIGKRPNMFFLICWKYISPIVNLIIIVASLAQWTGVSYDGKPYPAWAEALGWVLALASVTMVPTFAIVQYYHSTGTSVRERLKSLLLPDERIFKEIEEREVIPRQNLLTERRTSSQRQAAVPNPVSIVSE